MESIGTHNGIITLTNPATQGRRTFRIKTQSEDSHFAPGERIVSLLTGPENTTDYTGFGFVKPDGRIKVWRKRRGGVYETYARMLECLPGLIESGRLQVNYEGHCRRCNRLLTTPESVQSGIGPICATRI